MKPDQLGADARLAASRDRMRLALCMGNTRPADGATTAGDSMEPLLALQKKLQGFAAVCSGVAKAAVAPMAQKHPWGLVTGAFLVGGALVLVRPWRWVNGPTLVARLIPLPTPLTAPTPSALKWTDLAYTLLQQWFVPRR